MITGSLVPACRMPHSAVILRRAEGETGGPGNHWSRHRLLGGPVKPGHDTRASIIARTGIRRLARDNSGAAAIEFAIIALVMILVCLAVIEFGRGLHVRNEMSSAGDRAARLILTDPAVTDTRLKEAVDDAFTGSQPELLEVTFGDETADGVSFRTMLIQYPLSLLIPGLGDPITLTVSRRVPIG